MNENNSDNHKSMVIQEDDVHHKALSRTGTRALSTESRVHGSNDDLLDLKQLWRYILRHRKLIIGITCLSLLVAYSANKILLPTYKASTVIEIKQQISLVQYRDSGNSSKRQGRNFKGNQINFLSSSNVAERVFDLLHLETKPEFNGQLKQRGFQSGIKEIIQLIKLKISSLQTNDEAEDRTKSLTFANMRNQMLNRFKNKLTVEEIKDTSYLSISFDSFSPALSAEIANNVVVAFRQLDEESAREDKQYAQFALQDKLKEVQDKLTHSEKQLTDFSRRTGIYDLDDRGSLANKQIAKLSEEYIVARSEVMTFAGLQSLRTKASDTTILSSILEDGVINQLKKEQADVTTKLRQLSTIYQSSYPDIQRLEIQLESINESIKRKENEHAISLETKLLAARNKEQALKQALDHQNNKLLDLKDTSVEYNMLKREWESNKQLYAGLLERVKRSGVSSDLELARISIIDKAKIPSGPFAPKVMKNTLTAGMAGFFLSLGLAGLLGLLDRRIRSPNDLTELTSYPNLALIPLVSHKAKAQESKLERSNAKEKHDKIELLVNSMPSSAFSETFRALRTGLTYSLPGGFPQTLMITSSMPSEAKTTTITNLALAIAQSEKNKRVLILDLDLRKPRIHKVFGLPGSPGVTDCLVDQGIKVPVYKVNDLSISILPAGTLSQNTSEMLESTEFDSFFNLLKTLYDYILVDTPPVMGLADSLIISTKVDAVLIAVSAESSTIDSVKSSISKLETVGAHVIGTIMTKFNIKSESYYSGYYYQHYYENQYQYGESKQEQLS